jgi:hypothetical protein
MKLISGIIGLIIAVFTGLFPSLKQNLKPVINPIPTIQVIRDFYPPLTHAADRITKKTFGMYITPQNSPIQPERFTGYHTGTDYEVTPEELNQPVTVNTICSGKLLIKEYASGYGGVAVQACLLKNKPITVIYGHLKLASIIWNKGDTIEANITLGVLGANKTSETDGERKHLHLGIHLGPDINIRGYVSTADQLTGWTDPCKLVCK